MTANQEVQVPVRGSLNKVAFARVLMGLSRARASGTLYLLRDTTKKVVFFEKGLPVFIRSNVQEECLGQRLANDGLITQEQCDQTLEAIRRTGKKQGELLVEMGILSNGNLQHGLLSQLLYKLTEVLGWSEGKYQFKTGTDASPVKIKITEPLSSLILAGVLEHLSEDASKKLLSSQLEKYPRAADVDEEAELRSVLTLDERTLLANVIGARTVAEILEDARDSGVERPAALLHGMIAVGGLELLDEKDEDAAPRELNPPEHHDRPDDFFKPDYEHSEAITEYEDTPLPGAIPSAAMEMSDEDEAMFAGVEDSKLTVLSDLDATNLDEVEEVQEIEEIEEIEDDSSLELVDIENVEEIDLAVDDDESDSEDDGMAGAIHFARGESAFAEGDWEAAVNAFEDAYETGIDVAELHAMLAFSRYRTAEDDPEMVEHVVELLKYAEDLDPKLDSIYAFQGVVQLFGRGDKEAAKSCFNRAIELNPYSDLALEYIDQV